MRANLVVPAISMMLAAACPVVAGASVADLDPVSIEVGSNSLADGRHRPNVVIVLVDDANDLRCDRLQRFLPRTSAVLRERGTCYETATASSPLCAPSRAALQTGQLSHNNGVRRQQDAPGLRVQDTIQSDLSDAGYDTYGTGKFFNGVSPWDFESGLRPSGFGSSDFWASSKYYGYELWDDQTQTHRQPADRVHATTRTGDFLRTFISEGRDVTRPFYAYAAFKAPHTDNSASTETLRLPQPTPANAGRAVPRFRFAPEKDRRDKLPVFRKKLSSRASLERLYTARTRAMYDVDDEMGKTFDLLRSQGILDDTAIFFTSDHGYHLGENGWETKGDPYPTAMDVPLLAFLPGTFDAGRVVTKPVGLLDIAPTVHALAGVAPGHRVDGRSLLSSHRRQGTYAELANEGQTENGRPAARAKGFAPGEVPTWASYREGARLLVEYYRPGGRLLARELYADTGTRRNLLWKGFRRRPPAALVARMRAGLDRGRHCAGTASQGTRRSCP